MRAGPHYQSLIIHNNAAEPKGPAIPNVKLLKAPWVNREVETNVCWPYSQAVKSYALPLEGSGLGIEANEVLVDEALAEAKPFVPSLQPRLDALDGSVREF